VAAGERSSIDDSTRDETREERRETREERRETRAEGRREKAAKAAKAAKPGCAGGETAPLTFGAHEDRPASRYSRPTFYVVLARPLPLTTRAFLFTLPASPHFPSSDALHALEFRSAF
jgi:hypothetical protein